MAEQIILDDVPRVSGKVGKPPRVRWAYELCPKSCIRCGVLLTYKQRRQDHCSRRCGNTTNFERIPLEERDCRQCGARFTGRWRRFYCSPQCSEIAHTTMRQARYVDDKPLAHHFKRLLLIKKRYKTLSVFELMAIYDSQRGLCALTGLTMTWEGGKGAVRTNVSIDQIRPGMGYTRDNVQLVCHIVNNMKHDLGADEFVRLCGLVAARHGLV